jgi:hypothetical protein
MSVLLITVMGPSRQLDLVVPAGVTVATLLPPLADALGATQPGNEPSHPSLRPLGGDPLVAHQSLTAGGIRDGAILVLVDGDPPTPTRTPAATPAPVIAVLSADAGMGRTAATAQLAGALAARTGQLTVAVDAHPGAGSLSERLGPAHSVTAADLLALIDHPALTGEELCGFLTWRGPCLGLLPNRRDRGPPLATRDWRRLLGGLVRHGLTVVVDCPPGPSQPATRAVVAAADQLLLLVEPDPSAPSRRMARALADQGRPPVAVPWPAEICQVAETLIADWPALGLAAPSTATRGDRP